MSGESFKIKISPVKEVRIHSIDERDASDLAWCAVTTGSNRLFWINGYVLCMEIHDDAFKYEIEDGFFPVNQLCYAKFPNYVRIVDVEKGARIPLVNVSDMNVFKRILEKIQMKANST